MTGRPSTTPWGWRPGRIAALAVLSWALLGAVVRPAGAQRRFTTAHRCTDAQREAGCLIVLGSGTPVPDPARAGAAYAFVYGGRTFLFDAGAGVMRRAAEAGLPIDGFTGVFLTHLHSDHTLGLPDVLLTSWVMGRRTAMSVVGPPGTRIMVEHLLAAWAEDLTLRTEGLERLPPDGQRAAVTEATGGVVYDSAGVRITAIRWRGPAHEHDRPPKRRSRRAKAAIAVSRSASMKSGQATSVTQSSA